ncbi:UNVERIFIED_ORG: nucleoside hydrolase (plasmid) [Roseateles sp. XES5]|nr:nucleoside hydrolase [Roseateles sp. XES5]
MKAIIDTDPGIDDAMAIFFAASCPEIDLIGLTTVYGNVPVEMSTRNALHLVEMLGRHVPVAQGASSPLKRRPWEPVFWIHGKQGLGALDAPAIKTHAVDHDAADFLVAKAKEQKGQLVVFAIGPLTNIAMAIERDPEFASNVARIVVMGGVVHATGNVTAYAEANIYNDPDAAQIVFDSGAEVTLVGLDVTDRTSMTKADFAELKRRSPTFGGFLAAISDLYIDVYLDRGAPGCSLHDPATIIAATRPELFTVQEGDVDVCLTGDTAGKTSLTERKSQRVSVCVDAKVSDVVQVFFDGISRLG